jgi:histidinol-phosphate aminotransferase
LIVTRTFSKCYGIAQARVGYGVLSEKLSGYYDEIDLPFSVDTIGAELAREALLDHRFVLTYRQLVKTEKAKVVNELKRRGFQISATHESCPIFVVGHSELSDKLDQYFLSKKIHVLPGTYFDNLSAQFVRINTPVSAQDFIERLSQL